MRKGILISFAVGILCFVIGVLVGLLGMKKTTPVISTETSALSEISVRVNEGNLEWFNGNEWIIYGSVEELLLSDNMTMEELEEYYYPIIAARIETEESIAEAESIKASEAASAAEAESIAKAESEAASSAAAEQNKTPVKPNVVKPNTTPKPVQTQAPKDDYEEEDNNSSNNSKPDPEPEPSPEPVPDPDPQPDPEPEPTPEPEPDNSGDGEDMEWSPDIM